MSSGEMAFLISNVGRRTGHRLMRLGLLAEWLGWVVCMQEEPGPPMPRVLSF